MDRGYDYRQYHILFVDDEEQALKYFKKAFAGDFEILTASTAAQAWEMIENDGDRIGVVISDQRMPGQSGVDLLTKIRRKRPGIVRILTTAYSELDNAIDAVNSGAVFRYVTKPWQLRELRGILLRAMEFFLVQRERDHLMREKLSVLQRMIIMDRMRSFTVLAASLTYRIRNSMAALKMFFDFAPITIREHLPDAATDWTDLWTLAQKESNVILQAVDQMLDATIERDYTFADTLTLRPRLDHVLEQLRLTENFQTLTINIHDQAPPQELRADARMIDQLLTILLTRAATLMPETGELTLQLQPEPDVWGTPGVRVKLTTGQDGWGPPQLASIFSAMHARDHPDPVTGLDMLAAFFITYHHGGKLRIHPTPPKGPGFELLLPFDPEGTEKPTLDNDWLERVFTNLEPWEPAMS